MARYNLIKIGTIYLTNDGTQTGKECKTSVTGLNLLKTTKIGNIQYAADGTPHANLIEVGQKGVPIEITVDWLAKTVFDNINTTINDALNNMTTINVIITGDTGTFNVNVIPGLAEPIDWAGFSSGIIKGAKYKFVTT